MTLFGGGDIYAATIMVAVYMLGLGLGSTIGGHIADHHEHETLLILFAHCEIVIGFFALGSVWLYHNFFLQHLSSIAHSRAVLSIILFVGFLLPTILMGMSLPLLSKSFANRIDVAPRIISYLYSFNTIGASLGAFFTTWFLIRNFAIERSIQFAAILNFLVGLAVLSSVRFKKESLPPMEAEFAHSPAPEDRKRIFLYLMVYALSGFLALSLEMLSFSLLGVVLKASTFIFGQLLTIYLLGLGIGSISGNYWLRKIANAWRSFLYLQFGICAYSVLMITVLVYVSEISVLPSFWKYLVAYDPIDLEKIFAGQFSKEFFVLYFLIPFTLIFPATFMMGVSYPLIQKVIQNDLHRIGRHVGWLHSASFIGSVAGVITTAFIFFNSFGTVRTFQIVLLLSSLFLILLVVSTKKIIPSLSFLLLVLLFWKVPAVDRTWGKLHGVDGKSVLHIEDSSGLTVLRASTPNFSEAIVFSNGIGIGEIPYFNFHVTLGMLPVMLHPNPEEVAIIGL
ncbi:MAG TPA: fused MFS/spermidine synthase, partial [Acidobacteriota bacterium]|nr:fused MFS/spermidine synthase [Acidobacteriota bacterium]